MQDAIHFSPARCGWSAIQQPRKLIVSRQCSTSHGHKIGISLSTTSRWCPSAFSHSTRCGIETVPKGMLACFSYHLQGSHWSKPDTFPSKHLRPKTFLKIKVNCSTTTQAQSLSSDWQSKSWQACLWKLRSSCPDVADQDASRLAKAQSEWSLRSPFASLQASAADVFCRVWRLKPRSVSKPALDINRCKHTRFADMYIYIYLFI